MNHGSKRSLFVALLIVFLFGCGKGVDIQERPKQTADPAGGTQYKKELEEIKKNIRGDIRIKLKKDGKGGYGWEITGKDLQEVIKANNVLRSRINDKRRE